MKSIDLNFIQEKALLTKVTKFMTEYIQSKYCSVCVWCAFIRVMVHIVCYRIVGHCPEAGSQLDAALMQE